ncbi:hypothetical protein MARPU_09170 [Marichromatium purpuratum 984]|uniref:protein O-GlcNAc transferase n=1 Tax=Marichromatium purpuratum 984 TaxID=765910 RepID=W0E478_MARPU|nr:tetratricopeptide repeat protein [Marichromatium purpuratum]AHF04019.1 hypothetical protein MARPU_09170 [Marichromatium purpuratum 984]
MSEDRQSLLQTAAAHHRAGRLDVAEAVYHALLALDPDAPEVLAALARLREERDTGARRSSPGRRGAADDGGRASVATDHARLVETLGAGRLEEAEQHARRLSAQDDAFGWKVLGTLLAQRGEMREAMVALERAMRLGPDDPELRNSLGHVCRRLGRLEEAAAHYRRALALDPARAEIWNNLAMTLRDQAAPAAALECCQRALALAPDYVRAQDNLGLLLRELGRPEAALRAHARALELQPEFVEAWSNQGLAYQALGRAGAALASHREALRRRPDDADLLLNLGVTLADLSRYREALSCFDRVLELVPEMAEAHGNRGLALQALGLSGAAECSYRRVLALDPRSIEAFNNLGILLHELGRSEEALRCLEQALSIDGENANAHNNRANVLKDLGRLEEAITGFERACALEPGQIQAESNRLFTINYHPDWSAEEVYAAYRDYDRRHGEAARAHWRAHTNTRDAERRLRLGYVSPDFRSHAIRYMLEPLLEHHDRTRFELHAYAELTREDAQTARYRSLVDHWVPTRGLNDGELAARIRADGIDILVDLAGHTAGNRLGVFAYKPAPVSVSAWVGYGYTTGLSAIDYFLADEVLVPEGSEGLFSERPWRLAAPGGVYRPSAGMGAVNVLPALERGAVTFGTLTRGVRINHRVVRVWSEILDRVPGSRLVIDSRTYADASVAERLAARFAAHGIARERLEIGYHSPPWDVLRGMDIGLDCFPHNSGTTLMESLYMGVPFVTLADRPSVGRIGATILAGIGRDAWIAPDEAGYVERAVALAADLAGLAAIRAGLRGEMEASAWRDEPGGIARIEAAYRAMWRRWCSLEGAEEGGEEN